jgi:2-phospho-L-lactate/phosphoenolpyruvate guanylyltransferase
MFSDVLTTLRHVPALDAVAVVTADRTAEAAALGERVQVLRDTEQAGQSAAALIGIRYAQAAGYERVLLVPGDTPMIEPADVEGLLALDAPVAIVPDRHGTGTNALLIAPPDAIEPSFGPDSCARHVAAADAAGVPHRVEEVPGLTLDVDTPGDLAELAAALEGRRGQAPSTRGALRQLERAGAWTAPARTPV